MPHTSPHSGEVLALLAELLDVERPEVLRRLAGEPLEVREEVLALLAIDDEAVELDADEAAWALALDLDAPAPVGPPEAPPGYDLHELLGRGGMGAVYRATQHAPRREVALKFVDHDALAEAQALADADLPLIPTVYEVGEHAGGGYLAMERVQGTSLSAWARTHDRSEQLRLLEDLCRGVHRMHGRGVVHRDLKPDNLLVGAGDTVRLLDFGLAFHVADGASGLAGTPAYMADEVLAGEPATAASDVFSLAAVVLEVLAGERAMPDATLPTVQRRARLDWHPPRVDPAVDAVVARGLAPREQRYPDAEALAEALADLRARSAGGRRLPAIGGGLLLIVLCLLLFAVLDPGREGRAASRLADLQAGLSDQPGEALEELERFLRLPAVRGTAAEQEARLLAAERHHLLGASDRERQELALVFAEGRGTQRERAATLLAERLRQTRSWRSLDVLLPNLPAAGRREELTRETSIALRAWERSEVQADPLFRELARATRTELTATRWERAAGRFAAFEREQVTLGPITQDLSGGRSLPMPAQETRGVGWLVDLDGPLVVAPVGDRRTVRLLRPTEAGWELEVERDLPGKVWSVVAGDLNDDGVPSLFFGTAPDARTLRVLEPPEWEVRVVAPELDAMDSDMEDLQVVDLDRDGRDELIVHAGPWTAHDLRVYRQGADGRLTLLDRVQLGGLARTAVVDLPSGERRLAVVKVDRYPNPALFGADHPFGEPAGLYVFRFDGERLRREGAWPVDGLTLHGQDLYAGDFDGDGRTELAAHARDGLELLRLDAAGALLSSHTVLGVEVLGASDLDGDDDDELLVREGPGAPLWILGAGTDRLPSLAVERQSGGDPLEQLGLYREAAERQLRAAERTNGPEAADWLERASRSFVAAGAYRDGLSALARAVEEEPTAARREAWQELAERLGLADGEHVIELDFRGQLPALVWERPTALLHEPEVGLGLEASSGDGLLFSLPLQRTEGPLALEAELDLAHAEAGAILSVALVGPDGDLLAVGADPWGGARQVNRKSHCRAAGLLNDLGLFEGLHPALDRRTSHRMRVSLAGGRLTCLLEQEGRSEFASLEHTEPVPGDLRLEVRMEGPAPAAFLRGVLKRVRLAGVQAGEAHSGPGAEAAVRGDRRRAGGELGAALDRVELLGRMGRLEEAADLLRQSGPHDDAAILPAFRRQPEIWLDLLEAAVPERLPVLVARGWTVAHQSGASEELERLVRRPAIDRLPITHPDVARFLLAHATRLVESDRPERALRVYRRVEPSVQGRLRVDAALGSATASARMGDDLETREACARARAVPDQPPLLVEDRITADRDLARVCGL